MIIKHFRNCVTNLSGFVMQARARTAAHVLHEGLPPTSAVVQEGSQVRTALPPFLTHAETDLAKMAASAKRT